MKINVCVVFGGRSTEHEVAIFSANQAIHAMKDEFNEIPLYITKEGVMYTGEALFDIKNYVNIGGIIHKKRKMAISSIFLKVIITIYFY